MYGFIERLSFLSKNLKKNYNLRFFYVYADENTQLSKNVFSKTIHISYTGVLLSYLYLFNLYESGIKKDITKLEFIKHCAP